MRLIMGKENVHQPNRFTKAGELLLLLVSASRALLVDGYESVEIEVDELLQLC